MLRTKLRVRGKATAVAHRLLLLSLLLCQVSPMHNEWCDPVLTHQQPVQTCRQFQVHLMTPFSLILLPQPTMNSVVHNR